MKRTTSISILLLFATISIKTQSGITTLADKTALKTAIKNHERVVVIFAAEWCDYCKAFLPKVEKIASGYKSVSSIKLAATVCDRKKQLLFPQNIW